MRQGSLFEGELAAKQTEGVCSLIKNRKLSVIFLFMDDGSMTLWVALVILVGFSAFFSASETAFSSLNQIRLKSRAEDGDSSAARVLAMSEQYDKLLLHHPHWQQYRQHCRRFHRHRPLYPDAGCRAGAQRCLPLC